MLVVKDLAVTDERIELLVGAPDTAVHDSVIPVKRSDVIGRAVEDLADRVPRMAEDLIFALEKIEEYEQRAAGDRRRKTKAPM